MLLIRISFEINLHPEGLEWLSVGLLTPPNALPATSIHFLSRMANILLVVFVVFDLLEPMPEDFAHLMRLHLLACRTLRNTKAVVGAFEAERRPTILDGVPPTAATDTRYEPVAGSGTAPLGYAPYQS